MHVPRWWFQKFSVIPVLVLAAEILFCHYLSDLLTLILILLMLTVIPLIRLNSEKPLTISNSTYQCLTPKPWPNRSIRRDRWRSKSTRRRSLSSAGSTSGLTSPIWGNEFAWRARAWSREQPTWPTEPPANRNRSCKWLCISRYGVSTGNGIAYVGLRFYCTGFNRHLNAKKPLVSMELGTRRTRQHQSIIAIGIFLFLKSSQSHSVCSFLFWFCPVCVCLYISISALLRLIRAVCIFQFTFI